MTTDPHDVDIHVGLRIRAFRRRQGMSQDKLARLAGTSFQQIQKYERATNRVSSSRLFLIATALGHSMADFYDGLPQPTVTTGLDTETVRSVDRFLAVPMAAKVVEIYPRLSSHARTALVNTAQALADA